MLKTKSIIAAAALLCSAIFSDAQGQTATYDVNTHILTIPSIQVGNNVYSNLSYRVDSGAVQSVGPGVPVGIIATACTDANFTLDKYNAVALGMTVAQVNLLFGCQYSPALIQR